MLGNSSSGLMEAPYLSKYTINLGNRQEGRLKTKSILDCKCNFVEIKKTIKRAYTLIKKDKDNEKKSNNFDLKDFYGYGNSADKMAKIIKRLPIILEKKKIFYDLWKNS
jgi:UDP-N-acetylglucosamine 2-epimerase (non-hydrolysing)/GDP/UDP-N,N'-diacetylbacillosamine 2-epimerase (hydrolysing)